MFRANQQNAKRSQAAAALAIGESTAGENALPLAAGSSALMTSTKTPCTPKAAAMPPWVYVPPEPKFNKVDEVDRQICFLFNRPDSGQNNLNLAGKLLTFGRHVHLFCSQGSGIVSFPTRR